MFENMIIICSHVLIVCDRCGKDNRLGLEPSLYAQN